MNRKQKKVIEDFKQADFPEEKKDSVPVGTIITAVVIIFVFGGAVVMTMQGKVSDMSNMTMNLSCNCTDHSNFTTYTIPAEHPNVSMIVKDPLCNDFCYLESCRYGCSIWVNLGLADGRCQCELQQCLVKTREING